MKTSKVTVSETAMNTKLMQQKKAKQVKQLLKIINELNQDIYICVQDKKKGTVRHFSSDINKFGNFHIAQATKDVKLQKIEQFNSQVAKMQDKLLASQSQSSKDSSTDSKKDTEASSQGQRSEFAKISNFENLEGSDIDQKISEELDQQCKFEIFDNKSHFEFGDCKLKQLLQTDMLSQIELPNEMSYPGLKQSSPDMFDINQVSNSSSQDLESDAGKHDEVMDSNFSQRQACSKMNPDGDFGLGVDSHQRRSLMQNAMLKSDSMLFYADPEYTEEECVSESGEFEPGFSHESSMNFSNMTYCNDSAPITNVMSVKSSMGPAIVEDSMECYSDNEDLSSQEADGCDMFFSCADWETQIKQTQVNPESPQGFSTPAAPKRQLKLMEKNGCKTDPIVVKDFLSQNQFDVDLVMKNSCPTAQKLLAKRSRQPISAKQFGSPKKILCKPLKLDESKEAGETEPKPTPFQDLCLSPMGSSNASSCVEMFKGLSK